MRGTSSRYPGRKTDVNDSEWIAELLQHGLLRGSFIPPAPQRELRELTRQRTQLIAQKATVSNRIQKVLEDANIKLASVASDVLGVSGRLMLEAIIAGQDNPNALAELAQRKMRAKIPVLKAASRGRVTDHHRFLLRLFLDEVTQLEAWIARVSERIAAGLPEPMVQAVPRLLEVPGIGERAAENILSEIGTNMEQFPTAAHFSSWVGMSPGNNESAGKRKSGRTTKGNRWLRTTLVQVAWAASQTKNTYLAAQFQRLAFRRGTKRAGGGGPFDLGYCLLSVEATDRCLSRAGSSVSGAVGPKASDEPPGEAVGTSGAQGDPGEVGRERAAGDRGGPFPVANGLRVCPRPGRQGR